MTPPESDFPPPDFTSIARELVNELFDVEGMKAYMDEIKGESPPPVGAKPYEGWMWCAQCGGRVQAPPDHQCETAVALQNVEQARSSARHAVITALNAYEQAIAATAVEGLREALELIKDNIDSGAADLSHIYEAARIALLASPPPSNAPKEDSE